MPPCYLLGLQVLPCGSWHLSLSPGPGSRRWAHQPSPRQLPPPCPHLWTLLIPACNCFHLAPPPGSYSFGKAAPRCRPQDCKALLQPRPTHEEGEGEGARAQEPAKGVALESGILGPRAFCLLPGWVSPVCFSLSNPGTAPLPGYSGLKGVGKRSGDPGETLGPSACGSLLGSKTGH